MQFADVSSKVVSATIGVMAMQQNFRTGYFKPQLSASMVAGASVFLFNNGVEAAPVFGQFPSSIQLSSLNGANGFELNGMVAGDNSGRSVSQAGDVNDDGIQDIIIGAPGASFGAGKTYVVFGRVDWSSPISLSTSTFLNGVNGFVLNGVTVGDVSGTSVSQAGDVNDDGIQDIIIGAPGASSGVGKTYVLFGKTNWTSPISLSSLNGTSGFELVGVTTGDRTGISVSQAGDINNDGIQDIIIGAPGTSSKVGKAYVVFGKTNWSSPISLSTSTFLNGVNGFVLNGVTVGDASGFRVNQAGDVNNDNIQDIIMGAFNASSEAGKVYVVFGKANWTNLVSLSSLGGSNGFVLDGVAAGDSSGISVGKAGDVNHDGIQDIIIGADGYPSGSGVGKTYVLFGKTNWASPISLSSLNGTSGFELVGATAGDYSGNSVSEGGDINNDGIQDIIIGAPGASSKVGKAYVVFGKANWSSSILLSSLNGVNGFELVGATAGDLISSVSQAGDVNDDGIQDIIMGAFNASSGAGKTYVVFGDSPPVLVNNSLIITQGTAVSLDRASLSAYDLNHANESLVFIPSNVIGGYFAGFSNISASLVNFTQAQVASGSIRFVHDGSETPPSYNISVKTTGFAFVAPVPASISFSLATAPTSIPTKTPTFSSTTSNISSTLMPNTSLVTIPTTTTPMALPTLTPSGTPTMEIIIGVSVVGGIVALGISCLVAKKCCCNTQEKKQTAEYHRPRPQRKQEMEMHHRQEKRTSQRSLRREHSAKRLAPQAQILVYDVVPPVIPSQDGIQNVAPIVQNAVMAPHPSAINNFPVAVHDDVPAMMAHNNDHLYDKAVLVRSNPGYEAVNIPVAGGVNANQYGILSIAPSAPDYDAMRAPLSLAQREGGAITFSFDQQRNQEPADNQEGAAPSLLLLGNK